MTETPITTPPPKRDWKGVVLLVAFASLVAAALWAQWRMTPGSAEESAQARLDRVESMVLLLLLAVVGVSLLMLWRLAQRVRTEAAQRRGAVQELRESEAKYRSIFDNAIEGMFQTTPEGRFITANK